MTGQALSGKQRRALRGLAHELEPVAHVGKQGLEDAVLGEIDRGLERHELIKVRFVGEATEQKKALSTEIAARLGCHEVGRIGHVAVFYRQSSDPERRRIRLP